MRKLLFLVVAIATAGKIGYELGVFEGIYRMLDPRYANKYIRALVFNEPLPSWKDHVRIEELRIKALEAYMAREPQRRDNDGQLQSRQN